MDVTLKKYTEYMLDDLKNVTHTTLEKSALRRQDAKHTLQEGVLYVLKVCFAS